MKILAQKFINIFNRLYFFVTTLPVRVLRSIIHFEKLYFIIFDKNKLPVHYSYYRSRLSIWILELIFYFTDIAGIPEFLEIINDLIHWKNRKLNSEEKLIIDKIFGKSINPGLIFVDQYKRYLPGKANAFVGFNTIFFNTKISGILLVHEATHCWQYQRFGSVYILRALLAQYSGDGYNYGGFTKIKKALDNHNIGAFNYEQQAEIIEDYYKLISGDLSDYDKEKLGIYQDYLNSIGISIN